MKSAQISQKGFSSLFLLLIISTAVFLLSLGYFAKLGPFQLLKNQQPPKAYRIVHVLQNRKNFIPLEEGLKEKLAELGFTQGKNLTFSVIEVPSDKNDPEFKNKIRGVLDSKPDVITSITTETIQELYNTIKERGGKQPLIAISAFDLSFIGITDFKGSGSFVAGVVGGTQSIMQKRLQITKSILPDLKKVGILANPKQNLYKSTIDPLKDAAEKQGLAIMVYDITTDAELTTALNNLKKGDVDILMTAPQSLVTKELDKIYTTATDKKIPTLEWRPVVTDKVFINYATSYKSLGEEAAVLADKILKGSEPGQLPLSEPKKVEFSINLKIAEQLKIKVPEEIISQVDKVIK